VGLQAAGAARLVFEGEPDEHRLSRTGLASYAMELPHGLVAIVRTGEWIRPDGRSGFAPDRVVPPSDDPSRALDVAVELARDGATAEAPAGGVAAAPAARVLRDEPYDDMRYPSPEYRLLALFRLWNVIDLFFPYKHLLDAPWDEALEEFVPRFLEAADELAYAKAVAALAARIQDTHAFVSSTVLSEYVGTHVPPIEVRGIEGESVVTAILDDSLREGNGLRVGDVVREIDGEPVERRRERLAPLFAHSTPQALRYRMHSQLLAGPEGTDVRLLVEGEDAHSREVTAARSVRYVQVFRDTPVFGVLPQGYGYMDLARLMPAQVDEAFEAIRETPAVIFDIRGYPRGTAWQIAPRLTDRKVATAQFRRPEPGDPEPSVEQTLRFDQFTEPAPGKWRYTGKVVALIDERAISQSEHTCLFLEAATDGGVVFVGSATNGANGDVTNVVLPGGIRVSFSGHDVRHADGRQLQRLGIQPHVEAVPTIAGTREGRDEVLERAVRYLREEAGL
jgi:C-terminal processing protease CtpA/Prc